MTRSGGKRADKPLVSWTVRWRLKGGVVWMRVKPYTCAMGGLARTLVRRWDSIEPVEPVEMTVFGESGGGMYAR